MTDNDSTRHSKGSLLERRARRIAKARYVTIGLAITFVALAFVVAIVIRMTDRHDFPSLGLAFWWAIQTVTTVGYGDIVPTTTVGRVIDGIEMVLGISFIAFLTATVTSTVIERAGAGAQETERAHRERDTQTILDALTQQTHTIDELKERLSHIEAKDHRLSGSRSPAHLMPAARSRSTACRTPLSPNPTSPLRHRELQRPHYESSDLVPDSRRRRRDRPKRRRSIDTFRPNSQRILGQLQRIRRHPLQEAGHK
jgi:voltage-gated potassium channel